MSLTYFVARGVFWDFDSLEALLCITPPKGEMIQLH